MSSMIFRQLFDSESSTFTYILADENTLEGIIIDPVYEKVDRDLSLLKDLGVRLVYTVETHTHADHITGASRISEATGAKKVVGARSGADCADIQVDDGDKLDFGGYTLSCLSTPGHTEGCMTYRVGNRVFTGDALFVRGTGRTDFQGGSPESLYQSITQKIFSLPDDTFIYPGHDYKGHSKTTVKEEKECNPRINSSTTVEQFVQTMNALNLPEPKKIHEAVPANMNCGNI